MNSIKTMIGLLVALIITQCGSTQKQTKQLTTMPFEVQNPYFQKWLGGAPGSGSGIDVYLPITSISPDIELKDGFFNGKKAAIRLSSDYTYVARFLESRTNDQDVVMHSDADKEATNTPPVSDKVAFPFALSENELGITYLEKGVLKYTKVSGLIQKPTLAYPSAPPKDRG